MSVATRKMPASPRVPIPTNYNRGYLGIQMEESDLGGPKIVVVAPKSPAEHVGLKIGDVILAVDGKETPDPASLSAIVGRNKPGDVITVRYRRGTETKELKATLDKRPQGFGLDRGDMQNSMGTERSERRTGFPVTLQHDTILKASDCGGPLVDLEGHVIGMNIARGGRTDTYAIPSEEIKPLLANLIAGKSTVLNKNTPNIGERIKAAEQALKDAETEKKAAEKKMNAAKQNLDKLLAEKKKLDEKKKDNPPKKNEEKK